MSNTIHRSADCYIGTVSILIIIMKQNQFQQFWDKVGKKEGGREGGIKHVYHSKNILHNRHKNIYCRVVDFKQGSVYMYTHV